MNRLADGARTHADATRSVARGVRVRMREASERSEQAVMPRHEVPQPGMDGAEQSQSRPLRHFSPHKAVLTKAALLFFGV